jgi:hypothetical protein
MIIHKVGSEWPDMRLMIINSITTHNRDENGWPISEVFTRNLFPLECLYRQMQVPELTQTVRITIALTGQPFDVCCQPHCTPWAFLVIRC